VSENRLFDSSTNSRIGRIVKEVRGVQLLPPTRLKRITVLKTIRTVSQRAQTRAVSDVEAQTYPSRKQSVRVSWLDVWSNVPTICETEQRQPCHGEQGVVGRASSCRIENDFHSDSGRATNRRLAPTHSEACNPSSSSRRRSSSDSDTPWPESKTEGQASSSTGSGRDRSVRIKTAPTLLTPPLIPVVELARPRIEAKQDFVRSAVRLNE
jgi:hypothetical protein